MKAGCCGYLLFFCYDDLFIYFDYSFFFKYPFLIDFSIDFLIISDASIISTVDVFPF